MASYVDFGNATKPSDKRSSICMSVAARSCISSMSFNFSGWEDKDGGERRSVRLEIGFDDCCGGIVKSGDISMVAVGHISAAVVSFQKRVQQTEDFQPRKIKRMKVLRNKSSGAARPIPLRCC